MIGSAGQGVKPAPTTAPFGNKHRGNEENAEQNERVRWKECTTKDTKYAKEDESPQGGMQRKGREGKRIRSEGKRGMPSRPVLLPFRRRLVAAPLTLSLSLEGRGNFPLPPLPARERAGVRVKRIASDRTHLDLKKSLPQMRPRTLRLRGQRLAAVPLQTWGPTPSSDLGKERFSFLIPPPHPIPLPRWGEGNMVGTPRGKRNRNLEA